LLAIFRGPGASASVDTRIDHRSRPRRPSAARLPFVRLALALVLCSAAPALADTIYLRSGQSLRGRITSQTRTEIRIQTAEGARTIPKNQIARIVFEPYEAPARAPETPRDPTPASAPEAEPNAPATSDRGEAGLSGLNSLAEWFAAPRPERAELRLGAGPLRSQYQSAFEDLRSSLNLIGSIVNDGGGQATLESPYSNRRLNGYQLSARAVWQDFRIDAAYSDQRGASDFTDLRLQRLREPSTVAATALLSNYQTRGVRQLNRGYRLSYSLWRNEQHDFALGLNWLRMDFGFDTELRAAFGALDSSLAPTAGGAIAVPGQSLQIYQRGYAGSLHWRWRPAREWGLAFNWMPPYRRRGEMRLSQLSGAYVDLGSSQSGRISSSLLDFDYVASESGVGLELEYALNEYPLVAVRMDYRRSRYDLEQFSISGTDYDVNSGLRVGSGPNVLQGLFFSAIFSPTIQPQELERQFSLGLQWRIEFNDS
jgi:hypothetical protein